MNKFMVYVNSLHIEWRELRVILLLIAAALLLTVAIRTYRASNLEYIDVVPTMVVNPVEPEPGHKETPEEILGPSFNFL